MQQENGRIIQCSSLFLTRTFTLMQFLEILLCFCFCRAFHAGCESVAIVTATSWFWYSVRGVSVYLYPPPFIRSSLLSQVGWSPASEGVVGRGGGSQTGPGCRFGPLVVVRGRTHQQGNRFHHDTDHLSVLFSCSPSSPSLVFSVPLLPGDSDCEDDVTSCFGCTEQTVAGLRPLIS